jgi:hypothetical protein
MINESRGFRFVPYLEDGCMRRQTKRLFMVVAALVLAAVAIAVAPCYARPRPETQQASASTVPIAGQDSPTVSYWHVWTDANGVSHQKRCELSAFRLQSISHGAAPSTS